MSKQRGNSPFIHELLLLSFFLLAVGVPVCYHSLVSAGINENDAINFLNQQRVKRQAPQQLAAYINKVPRTNSRCPQKIRPFFTSQVDVDGCAVHGQAFTQVKLRQYYNKTRRQKVHLKLVYAAQYGTNLDVTPLFRVDDKTGTVTYFGRNMNLGEKTKIRVYFQGLITNSAIPCKYTKFLDMQLKCIPAADSAPADTSGNDVNYYSILEAPTNGNDINSKEIGSVVVTGDINGQGHLSKRIVDPTETLVNLASQEPAGSGDGYNVLTVQAPTASGKDVFNPMFTDEKPSEKRNEDDNVGIITPFWNHKQQQPQSAVSADTQNTQPTTTSNTVAAIAPAAILQQPKKWNVDSVKARPYAKQYAQVTPNDVWGSLYNAMAYVKDAFVFGYNNFGTKGGAVGPTQQDQKPISANNGNAERLSYTEA